MLKKQYIHIVMAENIVFGAYTRIDLAYTHARTILGADVVSCELFNTLSEEASEDIGIDEYDDADDTPVISIPLADIKDKP